MHVVYGFHPSVLAIWLLTTLKINRQEELFSLKNSNIYWIFSMNWIFMQILKKNYNKFRSQLPDL